MATIVVIVIPGPLEYLTHMFSDMHTMSLAHFPGMIPDAFFGKRWPTCAESVSCLIVILV